MRMSKLGMGWVVVKAVRTRKERSIFFCFGLTSYMDFDYV